jgi:hypothetical protein
MSVSHTTPSTASAEREAGGSSLLRWVSGGLVTAAVVAAVTLALWPASEADKARDDGEQFGQAVNHLYYADSEAEVDAALAEVDQAVSDTREHAGDEVASQAADQEDALNRAVDGFVGANTTDDAFEADLYQAELDVALDDLTSQASDFRAQGPEVHQAFWEGVDEGLGNG